MKMPNFRLYDTQATTSLCVAILGLVCIAMLAVFVFRGFNAENMVVPYNPKGGLGVYRKPLVYGTTAVSALLGMTAGFLGYNSLGQKRNSKQGRSWLGMTAGALVVAAAPILFFAWQQFSDPIITAQ
ncbi:MAG: hypothetical protein ABII12_15935 [Planctomycetota bacterium]